MKRPLYIALFVLGTGAALAAAYLAGVYYPLRPQPAPAVTAPGDTAAFTAAVERFDYERAVEIITNVRMRGSQEDVVYFHGVVDTLHGLMLDYITQRLPLTPDERAYVQASFEQEPPIRPEDYRVLLASPRVDSVRHAEPTVVAYTAYNSVDDFVGTLSGHVCGLVHYPGRALLKRARGLLGREEVEQTLGTGLSCGDVMQSALVPLASSLREHAVIQDLNASKLTMTAHVRRMVAELATAEEEITADFSDAYTTKFLFVKSTATLSARAHARVKVGFDLTKAFSLDIDHTARRFLVRLPAPEVLSTEVDVEFTDVDNGTFVSIDRPRYNAALVKARQMIDEQVDRPRVFRDARRNAETIIVGFLQPIAALPEVPYDVYVLFPGTPPPPSPLMHQ